MRTIRRVSASNSTRFEVRTFAERLGQRGAVIVRDVGSRHAWRREGRDRSRSLAGERAAVRRLAMVVARGTALTGTLAAFAREVGQLLAVDAAYMARYLPDGNVNGVGSWSKDETKAPIASRSLPDGTSVTSLVWRSRRPARIDSYDRGGETAAATAALGIRSSVGAPIVVDGDLWGVMVVSSQRELLPTDTESRLAAFTALIATSVSSAELRSELVRLAQEHAALRRLASLVARGVPPCELFAAVTQEVGMLLGVDLAGMIRYEANNTLAAFAAWPAAGDDAASNGHWQFDEADLAGRILATGRSARVDASEGVPGRVGEFMPEQLGVVSSVGAPIAVTGRLWGALLVHSTHKGGLPPDTEARLEDFTELVSAAVASIQARRELATSRARIVAAGDEERRRVIRDLHDGAQQRLVHTVVALKLAREALQNHEEASRALVAEALENAQEAIGELRELAHGMLPSVVSRAGLRGGVRALASRMSIPVEVGVSVDRLPSAVEATAYFVVAEALTNITKHSGAEHARVIAAVEQDTLHVQVYDDGVGGARLDGSGLAGLADRLAAIDGRLRVESPAGGGTLVLAEFPVWG